MSEDQRWQRRSAERPGEILDAALDLFVDKGFTATRLDDIAKRAGVSKGSLYRYFDNKEAIFKATIRENVVSRIAEAEYFIEDYSGSASELLTILIRRWWQNVGETKLCGLPKLIFSEVGNFPELARFYNDEVITRGRKLISSVYQIGFDNGEFKAYDPDILSRLIMAPLLFGTIWKTTIMPYEHPPMDIEQYLNDHIKLVLNGLSTDGLHNEK
jgi:AcrR family transcriptional regulator